MADQGRAGLSVPKRIGWAVVWLVFGIPTLLLCWAIALVGILVGTHTPWRRGLEMGVTSRD